MHRGKRQFGIYNHAATQQYLMHSAKVVWGLQVLGLRKEHTSLEPETTCQAPYLLVKMTTVADQFSDDHVRLSFCAYSLNHGHMSDRVFKKGRKGSINDLDPSLRSNGQYLVHKLKKYGQRKLNPNSAPVQWMMRVLKNLGAGFFTKINSRMS